MWASVLGVYQVPMVVRSVRSKRAVFACVVGFSLLAAVPGSAQTWDGSESTDWFDPLNWSGNTLPGAGTTATVSGSVVHVPSIDGGVVSVNALFVGHPADLGGISLSLSGGASLATGSANVGEHSVNNHGNLLELQSGTVTLSGNSSWVSDFLSIGAFGEGSVSVTGGSTITANSSLNIGNHHNDVTGRSGNGTLTITGTGSAVTSNGSTTIGAGDALDGGQGTVSVLNGGKLTTKGVTLGLAPLSSGTITVDGVGSRWDVQDHTLTIGQKGTGSVVVSNGGTVSTTAFDGSGRVDLASGAGSNGAISVSGAGSSFTAGNIWAGQQGTAHISVTSGGALNASWLLIGSGATGSATAVVSGVGTVVHAGANTVVGYEGVGTLTLSDGATLRGPLRVGNVAGSQGTFNIGAAASDAAAAPGVVESGTLTFGAASPGTVVFNHTGTDYSFAPVFSGAGTVRHVAGTTSLTGNSGAFSGNTIVDGGTLRVLAALGGSMTVNAGGTLAGSGTLGATQVNANGTIAPTGTLAVNGNLGLAAGATYAVEVNNGASSQITATGAVSIGGGTVNVTPTLMLNAQETYRILAGATLTGTFDTLISNSAFVDVSLDYANANEVWLKLVRNGVDFEQVANTDNQTSVAQVISNLPLSNPLVQAMTGLNSEGAQDAMDQLSGDTHSTLSATGMAVAGQVQGVVMNRIRQSFNTPGSANVLSYMPHGQGGEEPLPVTFWLQGLGEYSQVRASAAAGGINAGTGGMLGGIDVLLDDWRFGLTTGYTRTSFNAIGRTASGTVDNLHAGIYAGAELDALRMQFNALHTWHGISSSRDVAFGGFTDTLTAAYGAQTSTLYGEAGYAFVFGAAKIEPFGSLAFSLTNTGAYTETGGAAALSSSASRSDGFATVIGLRSNASFALEDKLLTLSGMVGWQHQTAQAPATQFTLAGSQPFTVTGANAASNAFVFETGMNLDMSEQINLDLVYSGRISANDVSHSIKGLIAAKF